MGIQGLLPFLKKIHQPVNVAQFAGCTVAIDAYCWLHKGAFSCAEKLALGEKTDQYVYYCMKFINYMLSKNIKPVMVFDGCHLPSKKNVEKSRREKRELNRKKAAQFLREGRRAEARECLQRCIDISPQMALELMNVCRDKGVDCIVAPYEADAQLAYLNKCGIAQVIITEDSDLLLFGCERVLFKMDHAGNGVLIEQNRLNEVLQIQSAHFTFDKFRYMCILSGCDYLASLSGIGLAKANKVFKVARQADIKQLVKKLSMYLKMNITVPEEYVDGFVAADNTFLYQLVYDPLKRKLVPLNPYPPDINKADLSYAGEYMPQQKAFQVALGNINIYTGEKFADFDPDTFVLKYASKKKPEMLHMYSMWSTSYRIRPRGALHQRQDPDRPSLKGKEVVVKAHLRRSPRKRIREADESEDTKTDNELSNLYTDQSPVKKKVRRDVDDHLQRFLFADAPLNKGTVKPVLSADTKTDNELSNLYTDQSPVKKKVRKDVDDHLQRFLFADAPLNKDDESEEEDDDEQPAPSGPTKSPRFFNSLSSAHPNVEGEMAEEIPDKENNSKSPRNKFACKSPSKRPRFNLNSARPDVKSRFFAAPTKSEASCPSTSTQQKSTSPHRKKTLENPLGFKPVHKNTLNQYMKTEPEDTAESNSIALRTDNALMSFSSPESNSGNGKSSKQSDNNDKKSGKPFSFSKVERNDSQKSSPSPSSAFSWSKFKFARNHSSDELPQLEGNKNVTSQFKKVVSESNLDRFLRKKPVEMSYEDFLKKGENSGTDISYDDKSATSLEQDTPPSTNHSEIASLSGASGESYPYSIDSVCISQPGVLDSQRSGFDSQTVNQDQIDSQRLRLDEEESESELVDEGCSKESLNCHTRKGLYIDGESLSEENLEKPHSAKNNVFKANSIYFQSGSVSKSKTCDNTDTGVKSEPAEVVTLIDSDEDGEQLSLSSGTPTSSTSNRTSTSKVLMKPGCRVSGLRKNSKKNGKSVVNDVKQQNLKDMFSKFAHKKSDVPKLARHDSVTDQDFTPESSKSTFMIKSEHQRKLLQS